MAIITLTQGRVAEVDDADAVYVCFLCNWHYDQSTGYASGEVKRKHIYLHKVIAERMGLIGEIDHKDRDKLNCKRDNLRLVTRSQNNFNRDEQANNTTGKKGVRRFRNKWQAKIGNCHLGTFDTYEQAVSAREKAET